MESSLPEAFDFSICKEALEVLCFSLVLNHKGFETLSLGSNWSNFIISLVLINGSRHIRQIASEQIFYTCTYCAPDKKPFLFMVELLTETLKNTASKYSANCSEFFQLFCRVLRFGCNCNWSLDTCDALLTQEIEWIYSIRDNVKKHGETGVHEDFLEGRLNLTKELMAYLNYDQKSKLNSFIMVLIDDFLFPASKQYLYYRQKSQLLDTTAAPPVCRNPHTISAACDLLVSLCTSCLPNMKVLVNTLLDMFCFGKILNIFIIILLYIYTKTCDFFRSATLTPRMGIFASNWTTARFLWLKKCWCYMLYEFSAATVIYGFINSHRNS